MAHKNIIPNILTSKNCVGEIEIYRISLLESTEYFLYRSLGLKATASVWLVAL